MTIFTRLFGRRGDRGQSLGFVEAQRMVLDYARFLENSPPMPGRVIDRSCLPYDKAKLKEALLMCISNTGDQRLEEHLKHGYLMLSAFQEGVGDNCGVNFADLDLEADPLDIATAIEEAEATARPWQTRVRDELERLRNDLYELELRLTDPLKLSA